MLPGEQIGAPRSTRSHEWRGLAQQILFPAVAWVNVGHYTPQPPNRGQGSSHLYDALGLHFALADHAGDAFLRCSTVSLVLATLLVTLGLAPSAQAVPEMFEASFIIHAWGNDIPSGATSPYTENHWTAVPLGYDCQHAEPHYTANGASGRVRRPSAAPARA